MNAISQSLTTMRATGPLVHNITNYVAMNIMANVLLAAGASPAMVHAREEAAEFAAIASVLSVNIGTIEPAWGEAMLDAARVMNAAGKPWVLDPVAVGATALRRDYGAKLLALKPSVVRGNASEIMALAGMQSQGQGVDSGDAVTAAQAAAIALAKQTGGVVAVTGPVDFVTDGTRQAHIANGHAMMPAITALGCSLTGMVAAFIVGQPAFEGTIAALAYYGVAGEIAGETAKGPGSFQEHFLDALYNLTPEELAKRAKVEWA